MLLCLAIAVDAQLTPLLIGADIFTPPSTFCNKPDILNITLRVSQCNLYRSLTCNTTNYRCSLNPNFYNDTTNNGTFVNEMIKFTITTWAALMPGTDDGKVQVNVQYNFPNIFYLNGFLQLWKFVPTTSNAYNFTMRQYELRTVDAVSNTQQTYLFHGLSGGKYIFAFWDNGGTKLGNALPEFSPAFTINQVFTVKTPLRIQIIPKIMNGSVPNYDTDYQRGNKNFFSYELVGNRGFQSLFNIATGPGYNRRLYWEYRTDQGNIINAKTQVETVPAQATADGFVDTMFKFKIFPVMCCRRRSSMSVRLVYTGLFPNGYEDYFRIRQRYGYGTVIDRRVIVHKRTYLEDFAPGGPFAPTEYEKYVQTTYGYPGAHPAFLAPNVYVCVKDTPVMNLLTSSGNVDEYHVRTLRRNYCECLSKYYPPGAEPYSLCFYARGQSKVPQAQEAFKTPSGSNTNNFDMFEDYLAANDSPGAKDYTIYGGVFGRPFLVDIDFEFQNNNYLAYDYPCNPFRTAYTSVNPTFVTSGDYHGDGRTVFSALDFLNTDMGRVYEASTPAQCNFGGANPNIPGSTTLASGVDVNDITPDNLDGSYAFLGGRGFLGNQCNCLKENGFFMYNGQTCSLGGLKPSVFLYQYNTMIQACADSNSVYTNHDWWAASYRLCANLQTSSTDPIRFGFSIGTPSWGVDFLQPFYENDWRSNLRPQQFQFIFNGVPNTINIIGLTPFQTSTPPPFIQVLTPDNPFNYCRELQKDYLNLEGYSVSCISTDATLRGVDIQSGGATMYNWISASGSTRQPYVFNRGIGEIPPFPVPFTQATPFSFVYDKLAPPNAYLDQFQYPPNQGVYGNTTLVFGTTGLDTFIVTIDTSANDKNVGSNRQLYQTRVSFPTYARFKVIPEIEFLQFQNVDAGIPSVRLPSIDIVFRISCPVIDMNEGNNANIGQVGYCAQNWIMTNQFYNLVTVQIISGPTVVSEPFIPSDFPNEAQQTLLGDVYESAIFQIRIRYTEGDILSWYFFPKTEAEQPLGTANCGHFPDSGVMQSYLSITVPTPSLTMQPMIVSTKSVPAACEYNKPEMLFSVFRGQCFAYEVVAFQNLPNYDLTGTPLDYGRGTNYWFDISANGVQIKGTSVYFQPYQENTFVTVYDQVSVVSNVPVPPPDVIANYTNPMRRAVYCTNDTSQGICYAPDDDAEDPFYSGIDQWHYFEDGINKLYLTMRFRMNPGFSEIDNIGAYFCNMTTQFIDVAIWEIRTKPLFIIQNQCPVTQTAYYTYTVKYGKSIAGLVNGENFPCLERFITYAIILTSFRATPGPLTRIANCTEINNCCFKIDFQVTGNTAITDALVNMDNCTRPECLYEIKTSPMPNNTWGGLCLGVSYTFTIQSPAALVEQRLNQYNLPFKVPWRGPAVLVIPLPKEGFGFVPIETTNGNCEEGGSFVDIDFTYTDPLCSSQIYFNNTNPACQFNVLFAIEPINNAVQYTQTQARLNNPFWLNGTNIPVYNILNSLKFPEILNDPNFPSIPDGSYALYIWLTPPGPFLPFSTVASRNATRAVIAEFAAFFSSANGLSIIRTSITYPRCPATLDQVLDVTTVAEYPLIYITMTIDIIDQAFNGPYNLTYLSPSGAVVTQVLLEGIVVCNEPCAGFFPTQNNQSCAACDEFMRSKGFSYKLYVGTGVISTGESGLYFVRVQAVETVCVATYPEFITALNTLSTSLNCNGPKCAGRQDGIVRSYTIGGTQFPFLLSDFTQNADRTIAVVRYTYNWTYYDLNGTIVTKYYNNLYIPFVSSGIYELNITDYKDCKVNATCVVQPVYTTLELELKNSSSPSCTGQQGAITVALVNKTGYPPPPYILYKVGVDKTPVMTTNGYILTDNSVKPGDQFFYMVCSTIGCCSQILNLSLAAPAGFDVRIATAVSPCSATSATGQLVAVVVDSQGNPYVGGVTYAWYFNEILLGVTTNTVNGASAGVYRVVATSILGCTSTETVALFAMSDIGITYERDPVNINPGRVAGSIFGGNGFPYTVRLYPDIPPDDINAVVIISINQSPILTTFVINEVPSQATFLMRVTDKDGCQNQFEITGGRIPDTEPIIPPSPSPSPLPIPKTTKFDLLPILIPVMFLVIMALSLVFAYARHVRKNKYTR